uniref:UBC core domain-containing protein n=1 Tax=Haemonchus contortus TaxID=6289 RepID=A0A7I4Y3C3_HAECO
MYPIANARESFSQFPQPSTEPNPAAVRRLQRDFEKLTQEPIDGIVAVPDDANILVWHYVIKGSPDTPYEGGYYYGKILFQPDFPWKPPAICMLTPNGRFQTNTRLCLSISDYHPETWNPGWTVSSILVGLQSFMNEETPAAGVINEPLAMRRKYAAESRAWNLACPGFKNFFPTLMDEQNSVMAKSASASPSNLHGSNSDGVNSGRDKTAVPHAFKPLRTPERNVAGTVGINERRAQKRPAGACITERTHSYQPPQMQCEIIDLSDDE